MQRLSAKNAGLLVAILATLSTNNISGQNLLTDPSFESGTPVAGAVGGWATVVDSGFSRLYAHSGLWSMDCYYSSSGFHGVSVQSVTAVPGVEYTLTGWAFTPATLGHSAFGSLILFFADSNGSLLGNYYSSSLVDSSSTAGNWMLLSVSQVAPAAAATVWAETSLFNPSAGDAVFFDDLSLSIVPEPSSITLVGLAIALWAAGRSQHKRQWSWKAGTI